MFWVPILPMKHSVALHVILTHYTMVKFHKVNGYRSKYMNMLHVLATCHPQIWHVSQQTYINFRSICILTGD